MKHKNSDVCQQRITLLKISPSQKKGKSTDVISVCLHDSTFSLHHSCSVWCYLSNYLFNFYKQELSLFHVDLLLLLAPACLRNRSLMRASGFINSSRGGLNMSRNPDSGSVIRLSSLSMLKKSLILCSLLMLLFKQKTARTIL